MSNNILSSSSRRIDLQESSNISESRRGMWFWNKIHRGREVNEYRATGIVQGTRGGFRTSNQNGDHVFG